MKAVLEFLLDIRYHDRGGKTFPWCAITVNWVPFKFCFCLTQDESQLRKRVQQLESELAASKEEFQKQLQQKDTQHEDEVNLLKADMLVAIQVARSGTTSPKDTNQPDTQTVTNTISRAGIQLSLEVPHRSSHLISLHSRRLSNLGRVVLWNVRGARSTYERKGTPCRSTYRLPRFPAPRALYYSCTRGFLASQKQEPPSENLVTSHYLKHKPVSFEYCDISVQFLLSTVYGNLLLAFSITSAFSLNAIIYGNLLLAFWVPPGDGGRGGWGGEVPEALLLFPCSHLYFPFVPLVPIILCSCPLVPWNSALEEPRISHLSVLRTQTVSLEYWCTISFK